MFDVGDKIVYPMYGAGVIEEIEESEKSGTKEKYYVIQIPNGNMKIKLSAKKSETMGLRKVEKQDVMIEIIKEASQKTIDMAENWNLRYKENLEKIKTGKLEEVAEVVKNLNKRETERGLSGVEKRMLNNAKQIIISEIIYSYEIEKEKAEELLAKLLFNC